jgi:Glycosyl hydrolase family 76
MFVTGGRIDMARRTTARRLRREGAATGCCARRFRVLSVVASACVLASVSLVGPAPAPAHSTRLAARLARDGRSATGTAHAARSATGTAHAARSATGTAHAARSATGTAHAAGYAPLTPWRKPPVRLPTPPARNYLRLAKAGLAKAARWKTHDWYCEYLHCSGTYPLATIWGAVGLFETVDGLQLADPTAAHRRSVVRIADAAEHYWDPGVGGYAPYPGNGSAGTEVWFDDNGWLGLAFYNAYEATNSARYLEDAQRAFRFVSSKGWDFAAGGGMWWNTYHPYHSGPALASDTLLGTLLYLADHQSWQLKDVDTYVGWANAHDIGGERKEYLERENDPSSVIDYVQAPLIYAQYLLCQDGQGAGLCVRAGRLAATLSEQSVNKHGYRYNYGPEYDAIFMQWMMAYGQATGDPYWLRLAEVNAAAATKHAYNANGLLLGSWWGGPIDDPETKANMLRTDSATTSLFAWIDYYANAGPPDGSS